MSLPSLPESLRFSSSLKDAALPTTLIQRSFQPEGSNSFGVGSVIRIPIGGNVFIDTNRSYLQITGTVTNPIAAALYFSGSAYSLFSQLRVLSPDGAVIEQIANYDTLCHMLLNCKLPHSAYRAMSARIGCATDPDTPNALASLTGGTITVGAAGAPVATSVSFALPLIGSGFMNMTSKAHSGGSAGSGLLIPCALLQSNFILELTVNNKVSRILKAVADAATIESVAFALRAEYIATCVVPDAAVVGSMKQALVAANQKIYVSSYTYQNQAIQGNGKTPTIQCSTRARSIKSLFVTNRVAANLAALTKAKEAFEYAGTNNFYIQMGSLQYPSRPLRTTADFMANLEAAHGGGLGGVLSYDSFKADTTTFAAGAVTGSFVAALDLEHLPHESAALENGENNSKSSVPINVYLEVSDAAGADARQYDVMLLCDQIIVIDPVTGTVSASV